MCCVVISITINRNWCTTTTAAAGAAAAAAAQTDVSLTSSSTVVVQSLSPLSVLTVVLLVLLALQCSIHVCCQFAGAEDQHALNTVLHTLCVYSYAQHTCAGVLGLQ
jgi:hypothetical protein